MTPEMATDTDPSRGPDDVATRTRRIRALFARYWTTLFGAAVVTLATWPVGRQLPTATIGSSWRGALAESADGSLAFGRDILYTYGPLGYLDTPTLFNSRQWFAQLFFRAICHAILTVYVVILVRRMVPGRVLPVLIAFALMCFFTAAAAPDASVFFAMIAVDLLITRHHELPLWLPVIGGALAAFWFLILLNQGITAAFIAFVFFPVHAWCSGASGRRVMLHGALAVSSAIASTVLLWWAIGQPLGVLPDFLRYSAEMVSGYVDGMSLEDGGLAWQLLAAAVVTAGLVVVVVERTASASLRRRLSILVIVTGALFAWYKHAFIRHNPAHVVAFFAAVLAVSIAAGQRSNRRAVLMVAGPCVVLLLAISTSNPLDFSGFGRAYDSARLLTSGARAKAIQTARRQIQRNEAIPASFLQRMREQTVHFEPSESVIAWAYPEIRWGPLPAFDTYTAYTSTLDQLNAEVLASTTGPDLVLFQARPFDNHSPRFTSPQTQLTLLCYFDEIPPPTPTKWALFARRPGGTRCGPPVSLTSIEADAGTATPVPAAQGEALVVGEFHGVGAGPVEAIRSLLYKPPRRYISGDGSSFRFVSGTASQPHILRLPACLASRLSNYPSLPYESVNISQSGAFASNADYRVTFSSIPFRCGA